MGRGTPPLDGRRRETRARAWDGRELAGGGMWCFPPGPDMHLRFTEDELDTLVEMVSLAAEVASWNERPGSEEGVAAYEALVSDPPPRVDLHQLSILALAARYEAEAVAFWDAVKTDPDLAGG